MKWDACVLVAFLHWFVCVHVFGSDRRGCKWKKFELSGRMGLQGDAIRNYYHERHIIQDMLVPSYKVGDALEFNEREFEVRVWEEAR